MFVTLRFEFIFHGFLFPYYLIILGDTILKRVINRRTLTYISELFPPISATTKRNKLRTIDSTLTA